MTREAAIKACGNNPDSLANISECQYAPEGGNELILPKIKNPNSANKTSNRLTLYPNPVSASITAEFETFQKDIATIFIYSVDGKLVKSIKNLKLDKGMNKITIPTISLTKGVYTISIETQNSKWNEKLVVEYA